MLAEISAGLSSLKAISDIVKGLNATNIQASINEIKIGLQDHILEAQQALFAAQETQTGLIEQVRALEAKVTDLETWEAEKKRYALTDIGSGVLAYVLKEDMSGSEPPHHLCPNCYTNNEKSILQPETLMPGIWPVEVCHNCSATYWPHGGHREMRPPSPAPKVKLGYQKSKRRW